LQADRIFIGGQEDQWVFLWSCLAGSVQRKVSPYYEVGGEGGRKDPFRFLEYLETVYGDPHRQEIAMTQLEQLEQAPLESFTTFFIKFEQKLNEAGGMDWSDTVKCGHLRRAINKKLREYTVGRGVPRDDYATAVTMLRAIAVDMESLRLEEKLRQRYTAHKEVHRDQDGDTEMTGINALRASRYGETRSDGKKQQPRRNKPREKTSWIPDKEFRSRKRSGACLRCGSKEHFIRDCPKKSGAEVASVKTASFQEPLSSSEEEEPFTDLPSGKADLLG
jgi:hypothetical protein